MAMKMIEDMKSSEIMLYRVRIMKKERLLGIFDDQFLFYKSL